MVTESTGVSACPQGQPLKPREKGLFGAVRHVALLIFRKLCKIAVKDAPSWRLRAVILRWYGCHVGHDAFVGENLIIADEPGEAHMLSIGDRVAIAPRVTLVISARPHLSRIVPYAPCVSGPITIEDDAWLGSGVVVLPGVRIGEGAIVGANAVVTHDVEPYTIVAGVPAHFLRKLDVPWRQSLEPEETKESELEHCQ